jgi:hypothetical protein
MSEQRKHIWIHPFQTGLLIRIAAYCVLYQVAAWALFSLFEYFDAGIKTLGAQSTLVSNVPLRTLLILLFLVPPMAVDALRFAHRLVGPLYRVRQTIQAIAAGEPVALVQMRKGDLLFDLQDDFNLMLGTLEQQGYVVLKAPGAPVNSETPQAARSVPAAAPNPGA